MKKHKTGLSLDLAVQIIPFALAFLGIFEQELFIFYAIGLFLIGIWNFFGNIWHHQIKAEFKFHNFRAKFFVAAIIYVALLVFAFAILEEHLDRLDYIIEDPVWLFALAPVFQVVYFILTIKELNNLTKFSNDSFE